MYWATGVRGIDLSLSANVPFLCIREKIRWIFADNSEEYDVKNPSQHKKIMIKYSNVSGVAVQVCHVGIDRCSGWSKLISIKGKGSGWAPKFGNETACIIMPSSNFGMP